MHGSTRHNALRADLSVVIVNYNTRELLIDCLRSLWEGQESVRLEIIVVDNGSSDGSAEMVKKEFLSVVLIRNSANTGFATPNNQGMRMATGRYVMLLNSDTVVRPKALETLVRFMDAHPDAGACGPRLLNTDLSLQPSCRSFPSLWRFFCDMSGLETFFPKSIFGNFETRFTYDRTTQVDQPMGAALLIRDAVLETVGYLDEQLSIYYNEVDWCRRMRRDRWNIYFVHEAEIIHHGGETTKQTNRWFEQFDEMNRNCLYYYQKHFGRLGVICFKLMMAVGFGFRTLLWKTVSVLRPSETMTYRFLFAKQSFFIGLKFWRLSL